MDKGKDGRAKEKQNSGKVEMVDLKVSYRIVDFTICEKHGCMSCYYKNVRMSLSVRTLHVIISALILLIYKCTLLLCFGPYHPTIPVLVVGTQTPKLSKRLMVLHLTASYLRKTRLGMWESKYIRTDEPGLELIPEAHILVEELMVWANSQVAKLLFKKFPDGTILKHQKPLEQQKLDSAGCLYITVWCVA